MRGIGTLMSCCLAGPLCAHPHVFVDTKIEIILNDARAATGVRISWTYDDLYSLYIVSDMGLDPDWDGTLTDEELARLSGFDMKWDEGFAGDTYALIGDTGLALSRPVEWDAGYAGGKITSTHLRVFEAPVPIRNEALVLQVYDPGYYVAYSIAAEPLVTGGAGCTAVVVKPDADEAQEKLLAALSDYAPDVDLEATYPAVGATFAEEVRVTCTVP